MVFKIVITVFKANKTAILMKDDLDKKSLFIIVISELCQIDVDSYIHTYIRLLRLPLQGFSVPMGSLFNNLLDTR